MGLRDPAYLKYCAGHAFLYVKKQFWYFRCSEAVSAGKKKACGSYDHILSGMEMELKKTALGCLAKEDRISKMNSPCGRF